MLNGRAAVRRAPDEVAAECHRVRGGNVGVWGRVQSSEFIRAYTRQTDDSPTILFVIEHNICVQLRKVHTTLVGHVTLCVSCGVWGGKLLNS